MKVLVYAAAPNGYDQRLLDRIVSVVADKDVQTSGDIVNFMISLIKHRRKICVVLIHVGSAADVAEIRGLRTLLEGLFLILVTSGGDEQVTASCRRLYPRLLVMQAGDMDIVTAVITKRLDAVDRYPQRTGQLPHRSMESTS